MRSISGTCLFILLCLASSVVLANKSHTVGTILKMKKAPPGIVFEVVQGDSRALDWAIPRISDHISKLRARFPGLPMAVVTHGREQFALQKKHALRYKRMQKQAKSLVSSGVPVHICETHAGWRGVTAEDFPGWVTVSAAGPVQIKDYMSLGYLLVIVRR